MSEQREPDVTDDPRQGDTGTGQGYPEENPAGNGGEGGPGAGTGDTDAPDTSHPDEGDPQQATGNPDAAG